MPSRLKKSSPKVLEVRIIRLFRLLLPSFVFNIGTISCWGSNIVFTNIAHIHFRWNCHDDKSVSGPIRVQFSLPTGFHIDTSNWRLLNARPGIHVLPQVHDQIHLQILKVRKSFANYLYVQQKLKCFRFQLTNDEECFPLSLRSNYKSKGVNKQLVIEVQDQFSRGLFSTLLAWLW